MGERKQKKTVPLPLIVLVAVLLVGIILAVVLLNGPLASFEDEAERHLEKTTEECKKLLKREDYSQITKLFDSVSEYPQAQAEIKRQLKDHMIDAVLDGDEKLVPKIYTSFQGHEALFPVVHESLLEGADTLWNDPGSYGYSIFYQDLVQEGFRLEELDAYCRGAACEELQTNYPSEAYGWVNMLRHCEICMAKIQQFAEELMASYLEQGQYDRVSILFSSLDYVELQDDKAGAMLLERAYALMDEGKYADAQYLLYELRDCKHTVYNLDAQFTLRLATLYVYIEAGQLAQAEDWAMSFAGETREKLLEVLRQYTG